MLHAGIGAGFSKNFTNSVKFRNLGYGHRRISDRPEANGCHCPVEHKDFRQITKKNHFFDWKKERGIAGCLFAFVGEIALEKYFEQVCSSLLPKTELRSHYKSKYGMLDGGPRLFLEGSRLHAIVNNYLS
jgi:hypothetical protein